MKNNLVSFFCCLCMVLLSLDGLSQKKGTELIDSLEKEVARAGEDTNKVLTLIRIGGAWAAIDLNKAFPPVNEALLLSQKLHYLKGIANSENNLGLYISDTGNTHYYRRQAINFGFTFKDEPFIEIGGCYAIHIKRSQYF